MSTSMLLRAALLAVCALSWCAARTASPTSGASAVLEFSVDGGRTWQPKGTISLAAGSQLTFHGEFPHWSEATVNALIELSKTGGFYLLRLPHHVPADASGDNDDAAVSCTSSGEAGCVQVAVAPCVVFNSNFQEELVVHFALHDQVAVVTGLQALTAKRRVGPRNFCLGYAVPTPSGWSPAEGATATNPLPPRHLQKVSAQAFQQPIRHRVSVSSAQPAKAAVLASSEPQAFGGMPGVVGGEHADKAGGEQRPPRPEEEKSFFQKYWLWIMIGVAVLFLQSAQPPPEQGQRPGQAQGQGGAPQAAARKTK